MFEVYNPHPQGKLVGDCVKRALTKATGKTYQEVSRDLNRIKRELGARAYNSNPVWQAYIKDICVEEKTYPAEKGKGRMNGERFCQEHPKGTYVLSMAGHLVCCVDGVLYDTWDCREKCVYRSYKINKLVPMPGTEGNWGERHWGSDIEDHGVAAKAPLKVYGNVVINFLSTLIGKPVKKTRDGQLWIPLTEDEYKVVLQVMVSESQYKYLRWETKRGSKKSKIWDENTGMTIILKNGSNPYVWCTSNGE